MAIKAAKKLVLSDLITLTVISGNPAHGHQTEDIDVSDFTNGERMEYVPRSQIEETEISLLCEYDGTLATVTSEGTLTATVTKSDGNTLTESVVGYIKSAIPVSIDVGGERRLVQEVVFRPNGSNGTTTTA